MGDHENRLPVAPGGAGEQGDDIPAVPAVQISRRLIGQNESGTGDQSPADGHALLLSSGKLAREMLSAVLKSEKLENLLHVSLIRPALIKEQGKNNILLHIELGNQLKGLKDKADAPPAEISAFFLLHGEQILAVQENLAGCGRIESSGAVEQGGFPGTGFSDDGGKFSLFQGKRYVLQRVYFCLALSLGLAEVLNV